MNSTKLLLFFTVGLAMMPALIGAQDFGFDAPIVDALDSAIVPGTKFSVSGQVDFATRVFFDTNDPAGSLIQTPSLVSASFNASGRDVDFVLASRLSPEILSSNPSRIIDEATIRTYINDQLEFTAGLAKVVWGKGDSLRVLDVVNPHDYTEPFSDDLEGNKLAQGLFKLDLRTGSSGKLEALYVPFFQGDTLPFDGIWASKDIEQFIELAKAMDLTLVFPDTRTLGWGQGGIRYSDSWNGVDFGIQYYTGFLRAPVFNADPAILEATGHLVVDYNRYHQMGLDAAFVLAGFNLRAELAWHQTADWDGTDPLIRNPFASGIVGIDRTIGGATFNIQALGTWISSLGNADSSYDVEKDSNELTANIVGQIAYKPWNERVELSVAAGTALPGIDWMVMPEIKFTPVDDVTLSLSGILFGGDTDGQLGQYADRSYAEAKVVYSF